MKNNKGFTLIELLATITILSIIMLIAIPNVIGVVQRNKQKTFVEDAKKFISLAQYYKAKNVTATSPLKLKDIDTSEDIVDGPYGGKYDRNNSYVTFNANDNNSYKVCLKEYKTSTSICLGAVNNITETQLYDSGASTLVKDVCSC